MIILIDNGHGEGTPGKRSPDGRLREYRYVREIAQALTDALRRDGLQAQRIVPEDEDIPLKVRASRVNDICRKVGTEGCVLVSIHCNAAGNGEWMNARGWSAYTSIGRTRSDELATLLCEEARKNFTGQRIRTDDSDGDPDWESNFYILTKTLCPAVLTENFFMDNKEDVEYLLSEEGRKAIVLTHEQALARYVRKYDEDIK